LKNTGARAKWVRPENVHITLRFLGEISEEKSREVCDSLRDGLENESEFTLKIAGLGAFPNARRPNVVWLGIESADGRLGRLKKAVDKAILPCGFEPETRAYTPHLTVGRTKSRKGAELLTRLLEDESGFELGSMEAAEVHLVKSTLTPSGPIYDTMERFVLGSGQTVSERELE